MFHVLHIPETENVLKLTSSAVTVWEGGSVELVCVALLRDEDGMCVPYNVTWKRGSPNDGAHHPLPPTDDVTSLTMNGHVLRVSQVANSSRYCCQVHTDDMMLEECTTLHVVQPHGTSVVNVQCTRARMLHVYSYRDW